MSSPRTRWAPLLACACDIRRHTSTFPAGADPNFAAAGLLRPPLAPSERSLAPDLVAPINLGFRLRAILGVSIRAEVVRIMLTAQARWMTAQMSAGLAERERPSGRAGQYGSAPLAVTGTLDLGLGTAGILSHASENAANDWVLGRLMF